MLKCKKHEENEALIYCEDDKQYFCVNCIDEHYGHHLHHSQALIELSNKYIKENTIEEKKMADDYLAQLLKDTEVSKIFCKKLIDIEERHKERIIMAMKFHKKEIENSVEKLSVIISRNIKKYLRVLNQIIMKEKEIKSTEELFQIAQDKKVPKIELEIDKKVDEEIQKQKIQLETTVWKMIEESQYSPTKLHVIIKNEICFVLFKKLVERQII